MGNPFVHVELNTSDVNKAKKFYGQLFTWQFEDVAMGPSGHYTMIKPGAGTGGGMLKHPMPGEPSIWLAYVEVEDVKAYLDKAVSLGGKVVVPPVKIPTGTFAWFSDLEGNTIGLLKRG